MRYILYTLFLVSLIFGNEELNSYLNNKDLQHQIIRDKKNERIIIDLLGYKNRIIIFNKKEKMYIKIFDEKLYFCNNKDKLYSNQNLNFKNSNFFVLCSIPNVNNGYYLEFYIF